jgi:hypothetical protein
MKIALQSVILDTPPPIYFFYCVIIKFFVFFSVSSVSSVATLYEKSIKNRIHRIHWIQRWVKWLNIKNLIYDVVEVIWGGVWGGYKKVYRRQCNRCIHTKKRNKITIKMEVFV